MLKNFLRHGHLPLELDTDKRICRCDCWDLRGHLAGEQRDGDCIFAVGEEDSDLDGKELAGEAAPSNSKRGRDSRLRVWVYQVAKASKCGKG